MAASKSEMSSSSVGTSPTYGSSPKAGGGSGISLTLDYFRTAPGIVKLVELFLGVICMCCAAPAWTNGTHWFLFVVVTAFVATMLWCFIYLLNLKTAINLPIDWLLTELLNTSITTLLYFIAVIVQFCSVNQEKYPGLHDEYGRNITGGVFGVFNCIVYTVGCFYLYRDWKDSHPTTTIVGGVLRRNP